MKLLSNFYRTIFYLKRVTQTRILISSDEHSRIAEKKFLNRYFLRTFLFLESDDK